VRKKKAKEPKGLTEEKLEENINIAFGETSTMTLLFMYSSSRVVQNLIYFFIDRQVHQHKKVVILENIKRRIKPTSMYRIRM